MTRFRATVESEAVVDAPRSAIWAALTDPARLTRMTPLLEHIDADGDLWVWHMRRIAALGVDLTPVFTERMIFDEEKRIDFHHSPPRGQTERAAAEGTYRLSDADKGTKLEIRMTVEVQLPLPRAASPAVVAVMRRTMDGMGNRFSTNLCREVGAPVV